MTKVNEQVLGEMILDAEEIVEVEMDGEYLDEMDGASRRNWKSARNGLYRNWLKRWGKVGTLTNVIEMDGETESGVSRGLALRIDKEKWLVDGELVVGADSMVKWVLKIGGVA